MYNMKKAPTLPIGWRCTMKMAGCTEMLAEFRVDPTAAQQLVPQEYALRIHPDGRALLLLLVQRCQTCVLNGVLRVSPLGMSHLWIELAGPEEVGPALPGTPASLATTYWYTLPHQMDRALAYWAFRLVGIDVQLVKRIHLETTEGGEQRGMVIEHEHPTVGYSWLDTAKRWPQQNLVTGRRWFHRRYGRVIQRRSEGLVVCRSNFTGDGLLRLEADAGSTMDSLGFGTALQGTTESVEIDCDVRIRVHVERRAGALAA